MAAAKCVASALIVAWMSTGAALAADERMPPGLAPDTSPAAPLPPELRGRQAPPVPPAYPLEQVATPWAPPAAGPAYKAPIAALPPAWSWTGFYLGIHVGAAWDHRNASIYNATTGVFRASGSTHADNAAAGVQVGYNYALTPHIVAGAEADISFTNLRNLDIGSSAFGARENSIDNFGTVRGRLGYAWQDFLLYGTGGFGWANEKIVRTQEVGRVNNAPPGTTETASAVGVGWAAGAGIDWHFAPCWIARVEYLHLGLNTQSFVFTQAMQRIDASARLDTVRLGVSYKFD